MGKYKRGELARYEVVSARLSDAELKELDRRRGKRQSRSELIRTAVRLLLESSSRGLNDHDKG